VKYEALFMLFRYITDLLAAEGVEIVSPQCGELVTSLDMAGVSATLMWLDDDLERLWDAPALSPAFTRGSVALEASSPEPAGDAPPSVAVGEPALGNAPAESRRAATLAGQLLETAREAIAGRVDELGDLDAIAGDGDHGVGMLRGLEAAAAEATGLDVSLGVGEQLRRAGSAWADRAGGTSGALWGAALEAMGEALSGPPFDANAVAEAIHAGRTRIEELGGAEPGDKTIVDALIPYHEEFRRRVELGEGIPEAMRDAAAVAGRAAAATAALTPRLGRARPLAERSVGHPDPGAVSFAIIVEALCSPESEDD